MTIEIVESPPTTIEIALTQVVVETVEVSPAVVTVEQTITTTEIVQEPEITIEISAGPQGDQGPSGNPAVSAEADETIAIGQVVWVKSTTHIGLAQANAQTTARVAGIAITAGNATFSVDYVTDGQHTQANWTSITGATLLTPGSTYYLSAATAGQLTTTAPTASGFVVAVGRALNTTTLDIEISQPTRL